MWAGQGVPQQTHQRTSLEYRLSCGGPQTQFPFLLQPPLLPHRLRLLKSQRLNIP